MANEKTNPALAALMGIAKKEDPKKKEAEIKPVKSSEPAPAKKETKAPVAKKEPVKEEVKPEKKAAPSKPVTKNESGFEKFDINELMIKYRHKSKERGVQKTVYFSKDVYDYIAEYVENEGESFAQVLDLLIRKAITK